MAKPRVRAEQNAALLISISCLVVVILLIFSLSSAEALLLPVLVLSYQLLLSQHIFQHMSAWLYHDQHFSPNPKRIYKTKLQNGKFRLLRLLPGPTDTKIKCRLVEASLDNVPTYDAISYVWGTPTKREEIQCDGQPAYITISLAQALRKLRHSTRSKTLWADGICINQDNLNEKSHQVERMGEIYKKADKVVAWLGPLHNGAAAEALAIIRYVHNCKVQTQRNVANAALSTIPGYPTVDNLQELMNNVHEIKDAWGVLDEFFRQEWWLRIW